jgi:hypothetical protein
LELGIGNSAKNDTNGSDDNDDDEGNDTTVAVGCFLSLLSFIGMLLLVAATTGLPPVGAKLQIYASHIIY